MNSSFLHDITKKLDQSKNRLYREKHHFSALLSILLVIFTEIYFQLTKTTLVCARIIINKNRIYNIE